MLKVSPALRRVVMVCGILLLLCGTIFLIIQDRNLGVFSPAGEVASKQRNLIFFALLLSLIVVVPVFTLTIFIGWKYRATNPKAKYQPEWDHNNRLETLWWSIPMALIIVLSTVTWRSSHDLDPYKALNSDVKPLTVQVIALDWKWLFIYPDQKIASVNQLRIPTGTPVNFEITSNGPMNSFWVPQLGGQIYAMSGMTTKLHLIADKDGTFRGVSSNISGDGFASMKFNVIASSNDEFHKWIQTMRDGSEVLDRKSLIELQKPSIFEKPFFYAYVDNDAFQDTVDKFMTYGVAE